MKEVISYMAKDGYLHNSKIACEEYELGLLEGCYYSDEFTYNGYQKNIFLEIVNRYKFTSDEIHDILMNHFMQNREMFKILQKGRVARTFKISDFKWINPKGIGIPVKVIIIDEYGKVVVKDD